MKLKRLIDGIKDLTIRGSKEVEITGLTANSNLVAPGNLFIAKKGLKHDATKFVYDAVEAGAVAILTDMIDPFVSTTQIAHPDVAAIEAILASRFFLKPSANLKIVGITGTNGKTTVSYLVKHLFDQIEAPAGLIGTIEWIVKDHSFPGSLTTPDVLTCHKLLSEMVLTGCKAAILEVSSHGLAQNRVGEIDFDIGVFTNLSHEHIDYHGSMEKYRKAKEKLFTSLKKDKWAIFNADDSTFLQTEAKSFTYGIDAKADLKAEDCRFTDKRTQFFCSYQGERVLCRSSLLGKHNVSNLLAAISVGLVSGLSLETCVDAMKSFKRVPGRLERVKGSNIFVDFAHTPKALETVCTTLGQVGKGKLITVFGCGGERDREKRPEMGRIASTLSDLTIITSDNPRGENPKKIADEILAGVDPKARMEILLDRREAIAHAIHQAGPHDTVLIAGRGHEKQQLLDHHVLPFDDLEVAREIYQERECVN